MSLDFDNAIAAAISGVEPAEDAPLSHSAFTFPWTSQQLFSSKAKTFPLIGYGSLMNPESAATTFSAATLKSARPVRVHGAQRVYDRVMSDRGRRVYGADANHQFAVLNAYYTGNRGDWFNAVLFDLAEEDLPAITAREYGYDLIPAWTTGWERSGEEREVAFFFSYRMRYRDNKKMIDFTLLPHPQYHNLCERGCAGVSDSFLSAFRETTLVRGQQVSTFDFA